MGPGIFSDQETKRLRDIVLSQAHALNPNVSLIKNTVCGVRVEELDDPVKRKIRYLDKPIDKRAKGNAMEKILRT